MIGNPRGQIQMAGQGHSNRRHFIASAVILGLVIQAMMTAVMLPMQLGVRTALAGAADSNVIIICTPSGMKQISFDADGNPVEKTVPNSDCPVCDALAAVAFALPAVDAASFVPPAAPHVERPASEHFPISIACLAHNNRDPPSLA
jgi:hypothetical protein